MTYRLLELHGTGRVALLDTLLVLIFGPDLGVSRPCDVTFLNATDKRLLAHPVKNMPTTRVETPVLDIVIGLLLQTCP